MASSVYQPGRIAKIISRSAAGAVVGVVLVDVALVGERLGALLGVPDVRHDERRGRPGVGLQVPREREHLRLAVAVVAAQFHDAVLQVAPSSGPVPGPAGRTAPRRSACVLAAGEAEERLLGQRLLAAGPPHLPDGPVDVAGHLLGDDDSRLDLGDGAGLLDSGALADAGLCRDAPGCKAVVVTGVSSWRYAHGGREMSLDLGRSSRARRRPPCSPGTARSPAGSASRPAAIASSSSWATEIRCGGSLSTNTKTNAGSSSSAEGADAVGVERGLLEVAVVVHGLGDAGLVGGCRGLVVGDHHPLAPGAYLVGQPVQPGPQPHAGLASCQNRDRSGAPPSGLNRAAAIGCARTASAIACACASTPRAAAAPCRPRGRRPGSPGRPWCGSPSRR